MAIRREVATRPATQPRGAERLLPSLGGLGGWKVASGGAFGGADLAAPQPERSPRGATRPWSPAQAAVSLIRRGAARVGEPLYDAMKHCSSSRRSRPWRTSRPPRSASPRRQREGRRRRHPPPAGKALGGAAACPGTGWQPIGSDEDHKPVRGGLRRKVASFGSSDGHGR